MKASEKRLSVEVDSVEIPIDGTLDLHHFQPKEVSDLVAEYLRECKRKDIRRIRFIHGKGKVILRKTVHARLRKLSEVESFHSADETAGGWGATLVRLKK